jgi:hypothetical protein
VASNRSRESDRNFDLGYPDGWLPVDPPEGTVAVVVAPTTTAGFYSNLVVTLSPRPPVDFPSMVDEYLWGAISGLTDALTEPSIEAVWVTEPADPQPQQRLIVRHVVDGIAIEMAQHHTWLDHGIVVITASMAIQPASDLIAQIDMCLLSAADDKTAGFSDWQPADMFTPWSPAADAERIAHL